MPGALHGGTHTIFIYHWLSEQSVSSHAISSNGYTDNYDMAVKKSLSQTEPLFLTQVFGGFQLNQKRVFDEEQNKSTWVYFQNFLDALEYLVPSAQLRPVV